MSEFVRSLLWYTKIVEVEEKKKRLNIKLVFLLK